jgi:hypothetical protein
MFTKDDYRTLTASQRRRKLNRAALVYITTIAASVVACEIVCNKVEAKFDSKN